MVKEPKKLEESNPEESKDPWGRPNKYYEPKILKTPEEVAEAMAETKAWEDDDLDMGDEIDISDIDE